MGTRKFKTMEDYRKWLAYGHIHGAFKAAPGVQKVFIRGVYRPVKHKR